MMLIDIENDLEYIKHILSEHPQLSVGHRSSSYNGISAGNIITYVPCDDIGHVSINTDLKCSDDINTLFNMIIITSSGFEELDPLFKFYHIDGEYDSGAFDHHVVNCPKDQVFHHKGLLEIFSKFSSKYKALIAPLTKDNALSQVQARYNSERKHLELIVAAV